MPTLMLFVSPDDRMLILFWIPILIREFLTIYYISKT